MVLKHRKFVPEPIQVSPYYTAALTTLYGGDTIKRNQNIAGQHKSFHGQRLDALHSTREKKLVAIKDIKKKNDFDVRKAATTDKNRWDNFKEAKALCVKGYVKLNKKRNRCVYFIIFATYTLMLKRINARFRFKVTQFCKEILETAKAQKISFKWRWNVHARSSHFVDRIKHGLRYQCLAKANIAHKMIYE